MDACTFQQTTFMANTEKKSKTTRQHGLDATRKCRPPKQVCCTLATLFNVQREPWRATHEGNKTTTAPPPTREHARRFPARIGRGRHETSKVCESNKGTRAPKHKAQHGKSQKAHHTTNHTQERPRAPSGQEVCPCTHVVRTAASATRYSHGGQRRKGHKRTTTHRRARRRKNNRHEHQAAALPPTYAF